MTQLPASMRASVLTRRGSELEPRLMPVRHPTTGEVLVRVGACGLGRTVRDKLRRIDPDQLPRVPGHELVGTVVEAGSDVTSVGPGDRVVGYYYDWCGECSMCRAGRESICLSSPRRVGEHLDGGFAEYACLPESTVILADVEPSAVSDSDLTVASDALGTAIHVAGLAQIGPGMRVLIVGAAGGVGLHLLQVALARGANVTGVDIGDEKRRVLDRWGVEAIDAGLGDWSDLTARCFDVAVDLVGNDQTMVEAYGSLAPGGVLVRMVTYVPVTLAKIVQTLGSEERSLIGSRYCSRAELREAIRLLATGEIEPVVTEVAPLEAANDLIALIDANRLIGRAAVTLGDQP